jgi:hypothetical protein
MTTVTMRLAHDEDNELQGGQPATRVTGVRTRPAHDKDENGDAHNEPGHNDAGDMDDEVDNNDLDNNYNDKNRVLRPIQY